MEVIETETARFETEISEEEVHANWKLKGEAVHSSPVSISKFSLSFSGVSFQMVQGKF